MLHNKQPDYGSLRTFGSRCFPYIWDIKNSKFDNKFLPCVFLGYSDRHKGYRYYYPPTSKTFISRHVLFDKAIFPFKELSLPSTGVSDFVVTTFQEWHSSTMPTVPETHTKALDDIQLPLSSAQQPIDTPLIKGIALSDLLHFGSNLAPNASTVPLNHLTSTIPKPLKDLSVVNELPTATPLDDPNVSTELSTAPAHASTVVEPLFHHMVTRVKTGI